jgi:hypothetical protein
MGQEVMMEKDFPCPCGKGILRIQVVEHDVWASGRHERWQLLCDDCKRDYTEPPFGNALVKREHADEIEKRSERRRALGERATERTFSFVPSPSCHKNASPTAFVSCLMLLQLICQREEKPRIFLSVDCPVSPRKADEKPCHRQDCCLRHCGNHTR